MTDAELCAASSEGHEDAFVELVRRYQGVVCAVTSAISGQHALSEDRARDTFLVVWTKLPGIEAPDRVGPWLTGSARNLSRRSPRQGRPEALSETSGAHPIEPDADPEEAIVEQQERARVWRLLATLPERIREATILCYREEQAASRVAEVLGISVAATEQWLSRGRKQLWAKVERELDRELADALGRTRPSEDFTRKVAAVLPLGIPTTLAADQLAQVVAQPSPVAVAGAVTQGVVMRKLVDAIVAVLAIVTVTVTVSAGRGPDREEARVSDDAAARSPTLRGESVADDETVAGLVVGSVAGVGGDVVTLVPGAAIFGTVIDRVSGTPVSGATVSFDLEHARALGGSSRQARREETTVTGADGRFALRQLGAAEYRIVAAADHRASRAPAEVSLAIAEQLADVVVFADPATVRGTVVDAAGAPIADATAPHRLCEPRWRRPLARLRGWSWTPTAACMPMPGSRSRPTAERATAGASVAHSPPPPADPTGRSASRGSRTGGTRPASPQRALPGAGFPRGVARLRVHGPKRAKHPDDRRDAPVARRPRTTVASTTQPP